MYEIVDFQSCGSSTAFLLFAGVSDMIVNFHMARATYTSAL